MNRLLDAGFMRLRKSKAFYALCVFMAGLGVFMAVSNIVVIKGGYEITPGESLFSFAPFIGLAAACSVPLFTGTEYSDGTIRNKIITGHSRAEIYLSNLIINAVSCIISNVVYMVVYIVISVPATGWIESGYRVIGELVLFSFVVSAVFAALFTFISTVNCSKATSAVISIILALVMLFAGSYISSVLNEPEYFENYAYMNGSGQIEVEEKVSNDRYLEPGLKRDVYEFLDDFLPGGQQLQISQGEDLAALKCTGYAMVIIFMVSAAGIIIFERKDIK